MCQAPVHDELHGVANRVPRGAERFGGFRPGQFARPASQKDHVGFGEGMLTIGPGDFLDHDDAGGAADPAHAVEEKNQKAPNRDELERTLGEVVVADRWPVTTGTDGFGTHPWPHLDLKAFAILAKAGLLVNETREAIALVRSVIICMSIWVPWQKYLPYNNPPRSASTTTAKTLPSGPEAGWACPKTWCPEKRW